MNLFSHLFLDFSFQYGSIIDYKGDRETDDLSAFASSLLVPRFEPIRFRDMSPTFEKEDIAGVVIFNPKRVSMEDVQV